MSAANLTGGAVHSHRNGLDTGDCRCPWCHQTVSRDELIEIQVRQDELAAEIEEQVKSRLITERDAEIERVRLEAAAAIEAAQQAVAKREVAIRKETEAAAAAALAPKLAEAVEARKTAEQAVKIAKATFTAALREKLDAQAEVAAKARVEAVNAVTEKFFGENLRLQERVQELQRMLEKKTANELGDAGEIDLFEALMAEFPADQIARVPKGVPGPDIVQRVFLNRVCVGSNIFDSKNHKAWQNKWTAKLRQDQIDAGADHAVLVSTVFPSERRHLMVKDGVVVCGPAQAVAVAHMLRAAVIRFQSLKLSNADRDEKTARLYSLMTSDRATGWWDRIFQATDELLDVEQKDQAWQEKTRTKRTGLIRAVQVAHAEFTGEIDRIIGGNALEDLI